MATMYGISANGAEDDGRVVIIKVSYPPMTFEHNSASAGANEAFYLPDDIDLTVVQYNANVAFRYLWDESDPSGYWELLWIGTPQMAAPSWVLTPRESLEVTSTISPAGDTVTVDLWESG